MLKIEFFTHNYQKKEFFQKFNHENHSWIVSDLTSKIQIQKEVFSNLENTSGVQFPVLEENSVLRANELWLKLLNQSHMDYSACNLDFIKSVADHWLKSKNIPWAKSSDASSILVQYMNQLLPFFEHFEGKTILGSWFTENQDKYIQWAHWAKLCEGFWEFLKSEKLFFSQWAPGLLVENESFEGYWNKDIIFDLGSRLTLLEVDLIIKLSSSYTITVLVPNYLENYESLWPYKFLCEKTNTDVVSSNEEFNHTKTEGHYFLRHPSMLAEVKTAVAKVREWIDKGVEPMQITILAPDIEKYWPILRPYLVQEGVLTQKKYVQNHNGLQPIQKWLAKIRFASQIFSFDDLEQVFYSELTQDKPYSQFKRNFKNFLDTSQLENDKEVWRSLKNIEKKSKKFISNPKNVSREAFVDWLIEVVGVQKGDEDKSNIIKVVVESGYEDTELNLFEWVKYLSRVVSKIESEVVASPLDSEYIFCENIDAAEWIESSHSIILGLSEETLKDQFTHAISDSDIKSIYTQTGFLLKNTPYGDKEFELHWLCTQKNKKEIFFSYPESDFNSSVLTASKFWISGAFNENKEKLSHLHPQEFTRWDELQFDIKNNTQAYSSLQKQALIDLGEIEADNFQTDNEFHLSVSQVESYEACPFTFAAKKLFHLYDLPDLDLDVDHLTKGQLMHNLFEILSKEPMKFNLNNNELAEIVDSVLSNNLSQSTDSVLSDNLKSYYISLAKGFLTVEKEWRERFPQTKTVAQELEINGYWDEDNQRISKDKNDFKFKGYIDRVDKDQDGNYVIIDYKSSEAQARNYKSWSGNDNFQLSIYSEALENGCTEFEPGPVVGAFYYISKTLDRKKGFKISDQEQNLFDPAEYNYSSLKLENKNTLYEDINKKVQKNVKSIKSGEFPPLPKKWENCEQCYWRSLCRAPHLI